MQLDNSSHIGRIFQHEPLDHTKQSIRLVKVLPDLSEDGLIQCEVTQSTVSEASWTCLSYTWGDPDTSTCKIIRMNDCDFEVRRNLFNFLRLLQSSERLSKPKLLAMSQRHYWIDALCIDQTNNSERNHQVAQMGEIYAGAELVHIWLGEIPDSEPGRSLLIDLAKLADIDWDSEDESGLDTYFFLLGKYLTKNHYWARAWVTQEIVLARSIIVSLDTQLLDYVDLFDHPKYLREVDGDESFYQFEKLGRNEPSELRGSSLLYLLYHFRDKECSVPSDRVYSLLSLCDERHKLEVDYNSSIVELASQVLDPHHDYMCLCAVSTVSNALRFRQIPWERAPDDVNFASLCFEVEIQGFNIPIRDTFAYEMDPGGLYPKGRSLFGVILLPPGARVSKCLGYWLDEFQDCLYSDLQLYAYIGTEFAEREAVPFAEVFTKWAGPGATWSHLATGWKITVRNEKENVCAIRTTLSELFTRNLTELCASFTSGVAAHGDIVKAVRVVYDGEKPSLDDLTEAGVTDAKSITRSIELM
jgi:hypothetical protein